MIAVNMLRYHNAHTMNMNEQQLYALKMTVELKDAKFKEAHGYSNYEEILRQEAAAMMQNEAAFA